MPIRKRLSATSIAFAAVTAGAASGAQAQAAVDLDHLTVTQAASDLCAGKYTSVALVSAGLARAKSRPELNAFITLDEAGAMSAPRAYDAAPQPPPPSQPPGGLAACRSRSKTTSRLRACRPQPGRRR